MTGNEHPNAALIRDSLSAILNGDTAWLSDHLADDVVWHVGGNSRMAGTYQGKAAVIGMTPPSESGNELDVHDILANDDHAVVIGTAHLEAPDGDSVDYRFVNVFHIQDGRVTEAWGLAENDAAVDPFFDKLTPPPAG